MGKVVTHILYYTLIPLCCIIPFQIISAFGNDMVPPPRVTPFYNLIPRFKMPLGNLLHYQIPQWEVLYFLKYGVVPFIFYDPNFNRTNFITQVQKFKMYFDTDRPNRAEDEVTLKEFFKKHGYSNYQQFQEAASKLDRDNSTAEGIDGVFHVARNGEYLELDEKALEEKLKEIPSQIPGLDDPSELEELVSELLPIEAPIITENVDNSMQPRKRSDRSHASDEQDRMIKFWRTLVSRYPIARKYPKSLSKFLMEHDPSWASGRSPLAGPNIGLHRQSKVVRGMRSPNTESQSGGVTPRTTVRSEPRREKNFQTQGW